MNQNNDGNGAEGDEQSPRQVQDRITALNAVLQGRYNFVRRDRRTEDIAVVRASGPSVGSGNTRRYQGMWTNRRLPLFFPGDPAFENGDEEETHLANNGREKRLLAPVQNADTQKTQNNRPSASVERSRRSDQENRESAAAPGQQDASTGAQPWPEQIPSRHQLKLRQRRDRREQRQPRPQRAQQQGRDFPRRQFLASFNDRNDFVNSEVERVQKLAEASKNVDEAKRVLQDQLQTFDRLARGNQQQRPSARPDARRQRPNDPNPNRDGKNVKTCGNCGKDGHVLAQCVHPSEDGFVHGCSTCNKNDHESLDMCPFRPRNAIKLFTRAVLERQNRPPLAQYRDWIPLVEAVPERFLPQAFPWMPEYLSKLADLPAGNRPWDNFDYTRNDASRLPVDPATGSWAHIQEHKESLRRVLLEAGMVNGGLYAGIGEEKLSHDARAGRNERRQHGVTANIAGHKEADAETADAENRRFRPYGKHDRW